MEEPTPQPPTVPERTAREPFATETLTGIGQQVTVPKSSAKPRSKLGRYTLLERIGSGGMGQVFAAYDPDLDRRVAVKLLAPSKGGQNRSARLQREAQALARLAHPNVVNVFDAGAVEGQVFVAMELVEGRTLGAWLAEKPRGWRAVIAQFLQAGRGLAAAHAAGLVHRDVKPSNILVGNDGRVRVVDFGLAREAGPGLGAPKATEPVDNARVEGGRGANGRGANGRGANGRGGNEHCGGLEAIDTDRASGSGTLGADSWPSSTASPLADSLTATGARLGTPAYMAPEQTLGQGSDARSDQFSFCVALYEALYGERPFRGEDSLTLAREAQRRAAREAPANTRVPTRLRRLLLRGLEAHPENRFPTLEPLLDHLEGLVGDRRKRWLTATAGIVLVATATVLAVSWLDPGDSLLCQDAGRKWADVWNPERSAAVRTTFLATDTPYAADAWRAVDARLETVRARWTAIATESCEATHLRGEQSSDMLDLQTACLDGKLAEARAFVGFLTEADGVLVRRAAKAAASLGDLEACADLDALGAQAPLPPDPAARSTLANLRDALAEAPPLYSAGRYNAGLALAERLTPRVQDLDYAPLTAEQLYWSGVFREMVGQIDGAVDELLAAASAAEIGRVDEMRVRILLRLTWLVGVRQADAAQGHRFAQLAGAALERLGGDAKLLRAKLEHLRGGLYNGEGRATEAMAHFQVALDAYQRLLGSQHADVGNLRMDMAIAYFVQGQIDQADENFLESLRSAEAVYGPHHPAVSKVLFNMANAAHRLGRDAEAKSYLDRGREIHRGLGDSERRDLGLLLDLLGAVLTELGHPDKALPELHQAREILVASFGESHATVTMADAHLAAAYLAQGHASQALPLAERAVELYPVSSGDPFPRNQLLFILSRALRATGMVERARVVANEALSSCRDNATRPCLLLSEEISAWLEDSSRAPGLEKKS